MPRKTPPSLLAIVRHWSSDPQLSAELPESAAFKWVGLGEPGCMRCGWLAPVECSAELRSQRPELTREQAVRETWRRASRFLDAAHLVNWCVSQEDTLDNLTVLCHYPCHRKMGAKEYRTREEALEFLQATLPDPEIHQFITDGWAQVKAEAGQDFSRRHLERAWVKASEAMSGQEVVF